MNLRSVLIPSLAIAFGLLSAAPAAAFECQGVTPVPSEVPLRLELVTNLLARPVDVTAPPGEVDRLFVVEQGGRIRIIRLDGDVLEDAPFLDISSKVSCCGERGLLGVAFHPEYAENGFFFASYTRAGDGATVLARFRASDKDPSVPPEEADPDRARSDSELQLLSFSQPAGNHNGGQVRFGPHDGYLYLFTGDGGSRCDEAGSGNNAQNPLSFLGKILRLDVDRADDGKNYAIPPDNPFAASDDGVLDEVWALGLRNPWRTAFDPDPLDTGARGDLYIADVGQSRKEEVNFVPAAAGGGQNFEWVRREGTDLSSVSGCEVVELTVGTPTPPVYEYPHGLGVFRGCSITGGVVYRGCRLPFLHGTYFFADYCNNWVGTFRIDGGEVTDLRNRTDELNEGILPDVVDDISAFGTDGRGEVYICDLTTKLFRVVGATDPSAPRFRRGDANDDGEVDISDGVRTLLFLYAGAPPPGCLDAADADDNGEVEISDAAFTFDYLFTAGPVITAPGVVSCGVDPSSPDNADCAGYSNCDG